MPPLLDNKNPSSPSVFRPAALLRAARRQKGIPIVNVPAICILDPDGDIVRRLKRKADQNLSKAGPAITHNSMPSNWPDKRLASSDVRSARPLRSSSQKNCLKAVAAYC
jgi:hypothetical protein